MVVISPNQPFAFKRHLCGQHFLSANAQRFDELFPGLLLRMWAIPLTTVTATYSVSGRGGLSPDPGRIRAPVRDA
jgi:hypothetical protein